MCFFTLSSFTLIKFVYPALYNLPPAQSMNVLSSINFVCGSESRQEMTIMK